jgi:hypothetical protein
MMDQPFLLRQHQLLETGELSHGSLIEPLGPWNPDHDVAHIRYQ